MALRILIHGSRGRMGRAVAEAARETGVDVAAEVDSGDDLTPALVGCDVVIDFSVPAATAALLRSAGRSGKPVVIGTTGHTPVARRSLRRLAGRIPCVWSGNYSVGVNLLFALTDRAAGVLGGDYDAEVLEMHHRFKRDAPSGTAERLLEIILARRRLTRKALRHGRSGITGARSSSEVGVHSLRGGDVVGDHTVIFAGAGERLELTHRASDRAIFARGALRAAQWLRGQPVGLYDMQDVLGLR